MDVENTDETKAGPPALAAGVGGASSSMTTNPLNVGKFTGYVPADFVGYILRRPCN
jgi:hypothetical protein